MIRRIILYLILATMILFTGCQQVDSSGKNELDVKSPPRYIDYEIEDVKNIKAWVDKGNPKCEPNDSNKLLDTERYGSFDKLMAKIKEYGLIIPKTKNIKEMNISLAGSELSYDIFAGITCIVGGEEYYFATFMTYLSPEEVIESKEDSLKYIEKKYGKVKPKNRPQKKYEEYEDKTYHCYDEALTFKVNGKKVSCKNSEYIEEDYAGKYGTMIFIYDNIQVVIQRPYSNKLMQKALDELYFETVVP